MSQDLAQPMAWKKTKVIVIGAGFGGICMGVQLKRAGIEDFRILERAEEIGGIWHHNTYPGCGCDVPSHLYCLSFEPYVDNMVRYPGQPEILAYLQRVVKKYGLRKHLVTNAAAKTAVYNESSARWTVTTVDGREYRADVIVSAVGQLDKPQIPQFPGAETFQGAAFHTAQWDHDCDLSGRKVAVIGNGSSAAQLLPHVAEKAGHVDVYQRTPNWVIPKPREEFGPLTQAAFKHFPVLQSLYRKEIYLAADLLLTPVIRQGWTHWPIKQLARWHLHHQVIDPDLRARLTPDHAIGCKRITVDSRYLPTFNRENVSLVTEKISRLTPSGIVTESEDGGFHERAADVIIYATGFHASEFLVPMDVLGRRGRNLQQEWAEGAEAYLGIALPGFPNFYLVHGPNTILGHNSNIFMIENQVRFIMRCLQHMPATLEVRSQAMESYRSWMDEAVSKTVWHGCSSWYRNPETGRVTNPWPASTMRYWMLTRLQVLRLSAAFDIKRRS